ncbi:asparagine synthase (glutamine-hydrolyzing) [Herbaspirillum sp.]|uniref:asparagine synthase (glutamine-hydrolyzing) n=1 Tax=Herbaspirillum sp. TaxID=1890675 RepID=UPI001B19B422|nr:asparagine synthase (glutamine-hydrolyzing) [Herbaspirillum sp.]MBO9536958.1 asparagine synthase (glutamine-hydrolyzing) [Herbaspirillum sp.]
MCGIAGYWVVSPEQNRPDLDAALQRMSRRGPDDQGSEKMAAFAGELGLGHRRLSIIDLSSAGHQPMHSADGRFSIVYNGEIYNFEALRDELSGFGMQFHSQSDTEVLLAAWERWGINCLRKLVGMFAFAIADRAEGTLTCVRDAFGIKPFFYSYTDKGLCFASELPATVTLRGVGAQLNLQRAYDYLVHGDYDSTPDTFVKGIAQLEAGKYLVLDMRTGQASAPATWWTPDIRETNTLSFKDAADKLRELFLQSVRQHLRSDVPLGAALSGGIDSSAVVCAMRHVAPDAPIHTFSFIAKDSPVSEEEWVDVVNAHVKADSHKVLVEADELAADLDDMILAQGEPFGSTSIYAQYRVFKLAKEKGITVTLDGQGADELIAGYQGYPGKRVHSILDGFRPDRALAFLRNWSQWPNRSFSFGVKASVAEYIDGSLYHTIRSLTGERLQPDWINAGMLDEQGVNLRFPRQVPEQNIRKRRLMAELALSCTRRGLPALLRHGDRNSMRFSVESRVPFLTTEMAEFLFSLPEHYLISEQGETKHIFRAAMRGIVPDAILDRRDKIGFATPEKDWLMRLADKARRWLKEGDDLPFLNRECILEEFEQILTGQVAFSWQAWRWINFYRWHTTVFMPLTRA